jgi:hypothetical protein
VWVGALLHIIFTRTVIVTAPLRVMCGRFKVNGPSIMPSTIAHWQSSEYSGVIRVTPARTLRVCTCIMVPCLLDMRSSKDYRLHTNFNFHNLIGEFFATCLACFDIGCKSINVNNHFSFASLMWTFYFLLHIITLYCIFQLNKQNIQNRQLQKKMLP